MSYRTSFVFLLTVFPSPQWNTRWTGRKWRKSGDGPETAAVNSHYSLANWLAAWRPCRENLLLFIRVTHTHTHKLCWLCSSSVCFGCCCVERVPKSSESTPNFHIRTVRLPFAFSLSLLWHRAIYIMSTQDVGMLRKSLLTEVVYGQMVFLNVSTIYK